jgi:hypothetical protein
MTGHPPRRELAPRGLDRAAGSSTSFPALLRSTGGAALALALLAALLLDTPTTLTTFFYSQDIIGLLALGAVLLTAGILPASAALGRWSVLAARSQWTGLILVAVLVGLTFMGNRTLYHSFALSYDEVMAEFDAQIFGSGALIQAVPSEWQAYRQALVPHFLLPVPGGEGWVSAYLPVNALMRALFAALGSPALTGPVLLGVAVLTIVSLSRRLWPDRPDAAIVAAFLLALSPQALVTAMTPYAMTGHLTLNLVWLWLFLRSDRAGHAGAILIGFLACGLHQVIFHPLFVAPFLLGLVLSRRWRLAALYGVAYAAICLFWMLYWQGLLAFTGLGAAHGPGDGASVGGAYQMARLMALLAAFDWNGFSLMAKNLIRFVTWQSPMLLPLLILAWTSLRRGDGHARPLAAGVGLTIVAMFILLPYQGHGWGYRYVHGLLGSVCLLGAQGWVNLTQSLDAARLAAARATLGLACVAGLLVLPIRAQQVESLVAAYAAASAALAALDTDIVLIDDTNLIFGSDLVRNTPTLTNRPIRVLRAEIPSETDLRALCARGSVGVFGAAEAAHLGLPIVTQNGGATPTPNPCSRIP